MVVKMRRPLKIVVSSLFLWSGPFWCSGFTGSGGPVTAQEIFRVQVVQSCGYLCGLAGCGGRPTEQGRGEQRTAELVCTVKDRQRLLHSTTGWTQTAATQKNNTFVRSQLHWGLFIKFPTIIIFKNLIKGKWFLLFSLSALVSYGRQHTQIFTGSRSKKCSDIRWLAQGISEPEL